MSPDKEFIEINKSILHYQKEMLLVQLEINKQNFNLAQYQVSKKIEELNKKIRSFENIK